MLVAAGFALLLSWTVGALVRTAIRARENRLAQERAEAGAVAEQERVRIARDMHDVVAHSLAVVIAQADGARYAAASDPGAATAALGTISTTARAALADVRLLLAQLRHSEGDGPQPTLADLERLYAEVRAAGLALRVEVEPMPSVEPGAGVQLAVYRILQEALTNALRHGGGGADVHLAWHPDRVELEVRNPARPAPAVRPETAARPETAIRPGPAAPLSQHAEESARDAHFATAERAAVRGGGHGLIGMRERAQLAGGTLTASLDGTDFVVRAALPIEGAA